MWTSPRARVLLALLPPLVTFAIQFAGWEHFRPYAWLLFGPAVVISAAIGGLRGGVIATVVSVALVWWFFLPPERTLAKELGDVIPAAAFVLTGTMIAAVAERAMHVGERLRRARDERRISMFESAPEGIFITDPEGRYTNVNAAGCRMVGYSRDELTKMTILDLIRPEDAARLERGKQQLLAHGESIGEWLIRRKDGSYIPVEVNAQILPDGRWQGFVRDITERKRLEAEVHQAQERVELALDGADLAAWDWNFETGDVLFSPRWAEMRGYSADEIKPRVESWSVGIHPEDLPRVRQALDDHFALRTAEYECEFRVQTKSGTWIWILDRGKVFARNAQGKPTRMLGTVLDVTTRKQAEHEQQFLAEVGPILASSLEYEKTLDQVAQLAVRELADLCIVDIVSVEGTFRRLKAVCRDPARSWIGDGLMRISLDRDQPYFTKSALANRESLLVERLTRETLASYAQSEEHLKLLLALEPTSLIAVPLVAHGNLLGAIGLIASVSSRRLGPADLRLAQELARRAALAMESARLYGVAQRAIHARDDVLGIVAHDLRNPLNAISLQAHMLRGHDGRERKAGEALQRSVTRMNRLIEDILDVTRIEAGQLTVERQRVSTIQALLEVVEAQRPLAESRGLALLLDVAPDVPEVCGDRDRLLQICENLISNALKFTTHGNVTVGAASRGDEVLLWVKDTGPGLGAEVLPHIFDRFWKADQDMRRGAGLGLAIVKGLVEAHGGSAWAESTLGTGASFYFTIPKAPSLDTRESTAHRSM